MKLTGHVFLRTLDLTPNLQYCFTKENQSSILLRIMVAKSLYNRNLEPIEVSLYTSKKGASSLVHIKDYMVQKGPIHYSSMEQKV